MHRRHGTRRSKSTRRHVRAPALVSSLSDSPSMANNIGCVSRFQPLHYRLPHESSQDPEYFLFFHFFCISLLLLLHYKLYISVVFFIWVSFNVSYFTHKWSWSWRVNLSTIAKGLRLISTIRPDSGRQESVDPLSKHFSILLHYNIFYGFLRLYITN